MIKIKQRHLVIFVLMALFVVLQYMFWFGKGGLLNYWRYQNELKINQHQNQELLERNNKLKADIYSLQNETESIEDKARSELGLIKEGETFYHIIEESPDGSVPADENP